MKRRIEQGKGAFLFWLKENALQITMQLFAMVMLALATYITYRLAPYSEGIAINKQQIQANKEVIDTKLESIDKRLERIEKKLYE